MHDGIHKYICTLCKRNIYGNSTQELATALNRHNEGSHPLDCTNWTAAGITYSVYYSGPDDDGDVMDNPEPTSATEPAKGAGASAVTSGPLEKYTRPYGGTSKDQWGGAKAPNITEDDKAMLLAGGVRW